MARASGVKVVAKVYVRLRWGSHEERTNLVGGAGKRDQIVSERPE